MRIVFRKEDTVQVFRLGTTTNDKICSNPKELIVQTYTFSKKQFELLAYKGDLSMKNFFSVADTNCLNCPFNSFGACYTHKYQQYSGFTSMLRSISKQYPTFESIPNTYCLEDLISMASGRYVRYGSYGEPSLHPLEVIESMSRVSKSWTGYTHQYKNVDLGDYFMASTHNKSEELTASVLGYRSFTVSDEVQDTVNCPASKEAGKKTSCDKYKLCSGLLGTKSKKNIFILTH